MNFRSFFHIRTLNSSNSSFYRKSRVEWGRREKAEKASRVRDNGSKTNVKLFSFSPLHSTILKLQNQKLQITLHACLYRLNRDNAMMTHKLSFRRKTHSIHFPRLCDWCLKLAINLSDYELENVSDAIIIYSFSNVRAGEWG